MIKDIVKKIFQKASFALEVAEVPVRGHGSPDEDGVLHFDIHEPENQHSWVGRNFSGDGKDRFFATGRESFKKAVQNSQEKQEPLFIVASPFTNKVGTHNVLLVMKP